MRSSVRAKKLEVDFVQGVADKLSVVRDRALDLGVTLEETAFLGNDINDAECLRAVGVPVVPADAWPEVKPLAHWVDFPSGRQRLRGRVLRRGVGGSTLVPLPAILVGFWPAITRRQSPPSPLARQTSLAAVTGLWLGAHDPETRQHYREGHL